MIDRKTVLLALATGVVAGSLASMGRRKYELRKMRAIRSSFRPHSNAGNYLVRITGGPSWAVDEFATFDAAENKIILEGEEFEAGEFEFILA
jgi:hypothetical protein